MQRVCSCCRPWFQTPIHLHRFRQEPICRLASGRPLHHRHKRQSRHTFELLSTARTASYVTQVVDVTPAATVATGKGDPKEQFKQSRIPGSKFFDMDNIADKSSSLPHMLPSEQAFAAAADCLGIGNDTQVVVYDRSGLFSAARVWWTFKVFGHEKVAVLEGGLPLWVSEGYKLDEAPVSDEDLDSTMRAAQHPPSHVKYEAQLQRGHVRDLQQMLHNVKQQQEVVVDARGAARFQAKAPEPRPGMRGGHIPHSKNVPFDAVLSDGRLRSPEEIRSAFASAGVDLEAPLVTSCGTGVTASVLALALDQLSPKPEVAVYDGSWSEWGNRQDTPIETGE